jgi:hypothetical protein
VSDTSIIVKVADEGKVGGYEGCWRMWEGLPLGL